MATNTIEVAHLLDNLPIPALTVNQDYKIIDCNKKWANAVNASTTDTAIGTSALKYIPEDEQNESKERIDNAINHNKPAEEREYIFQTIDGSHKKATGSILPVDGEPLAHITLQNISEIEETEIEAEKRRQQIRELHDVSTKISSATSKKKVCEHIVDALEKVVEVDLCLVGLVEDRKFKYGAASEDYPEEEYNEVKVDSEESRLGGKSFRRQEIILIKDVEENPEANSESPFDSALLVPMGKKGLVQLLSYDKNAYDETDKELTTIIASHAREALNRIEREQELEQQRDELAERGEDLNSLKSILSRLLRHNLRNELVIGQGNAEVIAERTDDNSIQSSAEKIIESSERLLERTEKARELKDVVDTPDETCTHCTQNMVDKAVAEVHQEHPDAEITTDVTETDVTGHRKLPRAVRNIVENAVEHNDGVEVTVSVDVGEEMVSIVVEDTGSGIQQSEIEAITTGEETDLVHGSGVGLWLVKKTATASNGELQIENTGQGARVEIELPLAE